MSKKVVKPANKNAEVPDINLHKMEMMRVERLRDKLSYVKWRKSINEENLKQALRYTFDRKKKKKMEMEKTLGFHQPEEVEGEVSCFKPIHSEPLVQRDGSRNAIFKHHAYSKETKENTEIVPVSELLRLYPANYKLDLKSISAPVKVLHNNRFQRIRKSELPHQFAESETDSCDSSVTGNEYDYDYQYTR